jgi:RND family efflux transporter MFP subunit
MRVLALAAVAVLAACGGKKDTANAASASTVAVATLGASDLVPATRTNLVEGVPLSGPLAPKVSVVIGAPIAEQLVEMFVNEGDAVRQGQPIARFRDDVLRANALSARADLQTATTQVRVAAAESTRAETLFAEGAIARRDHDNTLLALESMRSRAALSASQAAASDDRLETATVKSPVAGVVSLRSAQAGDRVDFGKPIMTIVNNTVLQLEASVEARWLSELRIGRPVALTVASMPDTIIGRISRINPTADPATRQVRIYVDIPNPGALVGGLYASGRALVREARNAVAVPRTAVRREGTNGEPVVYVVVSGVIARRPVTLGIEDTDRGLVQITKGVEAGEQVIVGPVDGLADGMRVDVGQKAR